MEPTPSPHAARGHAELQRLHLDTRRWMPTRAHSRSVTDSWPMVMRSLVASSCARGSANGPAILSGERERALRHLAVWNAPPSQACDIARARHLQIDRRLPRDKQHRSVKPDRGLVRSNLPTCQTKRPAVEGRLRAQASKSSSSECPRGSPRAGPTRWSRCRASAARPSTGICRRSVGLLVEDVNRQARDIEPIDGDGRRLPDQDCRLSSEDWMCRPPADARERARW